MARCNDEGEAQRRRWTFYEAIKSDERILGDSGFVDSVLAQAEEHYTSEAWRRKTGDFQLSRFYAHLR